MGKGKKKKKKRSSIALNSNPATAETSNSLLDDIIEQLHIIKKLNGLVIGSNAVLRGIEKGSIDVVLLVSKRAFSALYHALNLGCKNMDVLFLQVHDISTITLSSEIPASAAYGIKAKALVGQVKFSKLVENIDTARNALKCQREKKAAECQAVDCLVDKKSNISQEVKTTDTKLNINEDAKREDINNVNVESLFHSKHITSKPKFSRGAEDWLPCALSEDDFPDYKAFCDKICISIK